MGYTRYWSRTEKKITADFLAEVGQVIADCDEKGIAIRNGCGEGNPILTLEKILINGDYTHNLDHETFYITNTDMVGDFEFTKTACKPYDYAVRRILEIAERYELVTNVRSDGENNEIISDQEYLKREGII